MHLYIAIIYKMLDLQAIAGLDWDAGNSRKNERHGVSVAEAEQVFFNQPLLILADDAHSQLELRYHALGKSAERRRLHVTFTLRKRGTLIRVISVRDMHRKERAIYEQAP